MCERSLRTHSDLEGWRPVVRGSSYIGRDELGYSLLGLGRDAAGELYALVNSTATPFGATGRVLRISHELDAHLSGRNEIDPVTGEPGAGDPDGVGTAHIALHRGAGETCFRLTWRRIGRPIAAHIHKAPAGVNGDIVVDLLANASRLVHHDGAGTASGCASGVDRALIDAIRRHPGAYYVNIHTERFPAGAIRGQLH